MRTPKKEDEIGVSRTGRDGTVMWWTRDDGEHVGSTT